MASIRIYSSWIWTVQAFVCSRHSLGMKGCPAPLCPLRQGGFGIATILHLTSCHLANLTAFVTLPLGQAYMACIRNGVSGSGVPRAPAVQLLPKGAVAAGLRESIIARASFDQLKHLAGACDTDQFLYKAGTEMESDCIPESSARGSSGQHSSSSSDAGRATQDAAVSAARGGGVPAAWPRMRRTDLMCSLFALCYQLIGAYCRMPAPSLPSMQHHIQQATISAFHVAAFLLVTWAPHSAWIKYRRGKVLLARTCVCQGGAGILTVPLHG